MACLPAADHKSISRWSALFRTFLISRFPGKYRSLSIYIGIRSAFWSRLNPCSMPLQGVGHSSTCLPCRSSELYEFILWRVARVRHMPTALLTHLERYRQEFSIQIQLSARTHTISPKGKANKKRSPDKTYRIKSNIYENMSLFRY